MAACSSVLVNAMVRQKARSQLLVNAQGGATMFPSQTPPKEVNDTQEQSISMREVSPDRGLKREYDLVPRTLHDAPVEQDFCFRGCPSLLRYRY